MPPVLMCHDLMSNIERKDGVLVVVLPTSFGIYSLVLLCIGSDLFRTIDIRGSLSNHFTLVYARARLSSR